MVTNAGIVSSLGPAHRRLALSLMFSAAALRATDAATMLGVTVRTVYRDVEALRAAGLAIEGGPGIGYRMPEPPQTAPLALSRDERRALIAGAKLVKAGGDAALARAAASLLKRAQAL